MDGTRTARTAALVAVTAVGLTLVASAVLTAGQRGVLHPGGSVPGGHAPGIVGTAADADAPVAPRTTPPPTFPVSGGVGIAGQPPGTLPATTVEHS